MVVAITPDRQVVLERGYKHGPRSVAVSLPAGYIERGEAPIDAARRELREETGYEADEWRALGSFTEHGNYGICIEHAFLALGARRARDASANEHDELEELEVFTAPLSEALAMMGDGRIVQLASASALALAGLAIDPRSAAP